MSRGICFLCQQWDEDLEKHHIFNGALRNASEKYGATVKLCRWCHQLDPTSAHRSGATRDLLHRYGQTKVMKEQGWNVTEWRLVFGKNYLDEDELEALAMPEQPEIRSFRLMDGEVAFI